MRWGLLSDVHANLPALRAAVAALRAKGVDGWLCAGDVVGYGPQPNECVAELAALDPRCVLGNHELIALGELTGERCGRRARASLEWTRDALDDDTRRWLTARPRLLTEPGLVMAHGSLTDAEEYVRSEDAAADQLSRLAAEHPDAAVLVLGHTHRARLHRAPVSAVSSPVSSLGDPSAPPVGWAPLDRRYRYLVNPGSVGQSRQRERRPLARFALLETEHAPGGPAGGPAGEARPVRVRFFAREYDQDAVRRALRAARLPVDSMHVHPGTLPTARRRLRRLPGYLARRLSSG